MSKTPHVLLVEDHEIDAMYYTRLLEKQPESSRVHVTHCYSLAEAVAILGRDRGRFDVIILDLGLEDSQGISTIRTLRHHEHDVPVIVLTGNTDHAMVSQALLAGANDYLLKKHDDEKLVNHTLFQVSYYRQRQHKVA